MNFIISEIKPGKCPECEHCHSNSVVSSFLKEREKLREVLIQAAKDFFGSVHRNDISEVIHATGELLLHENHQERN
jgi:hypothetical protein